MKSCSRQSVYPAAADTQSLVGSHNRAPLWCQFGPQRLTQIAWLATSLIVCSGTGLYAEGVELQKLVADDASANGWFGVSVALGHGAALIGANPINPSTSQFGPGS